MNKVAELLMKLGPNLSSTIVAQLVKDGTSAEAARKQVSRAKDPVKRLSHLTFPHSVRFLYLKQQFNSDLFWSALHQAVLLQSPAYGDALAALLARGGVVPKQHFGIVSGAPIKQKKHISSETIYNRFLASGLTQELDVAGVGKCLATAEIAKNPQAAIAALKARLIVEEIVLNALRTWLRNLALASFNKIATRNDGAIPKVGTLLWDLTGPSYLGAIAQWDKAGSVKAGFIACDILLGQTLPETALKPFLKKCATLRSLKRVGRCLQIFVADRYSDEAFAKARKAGIVPATPSSLFGKDVAEGLSQLTTVLTTAATASIKPEVFDDLFKKLGAIEGAAMNLRGALFEFIVAELVRLDGEPTVSLNDILRDPVSNKSMEVDVFSFRPHLHALFIECKGYHPEKAVDHKEVETWLKERVPFLNERALGHPDWSKVVRRFEFWTSGSFAPETVDMLNEASEKTKKYKISYKSAAEIKDFVKKFQGSPFQRTLNEHFFKHPLANLEVG